MTCLLGPLPPAVVITWPTLFGSPSAAVGTSRRPLRQAAAARTAGSEAGYGHELGLKLLPSARQVWPGCSCALPGTTRAAVLVLPHKLDVQAPARCAATHHLPATTVSGCGGTACGSAATRGSWAPTRPATAQSEQHPPVTRPSNTGSLPSRCAGDSVSSLNCCCTSAAARWLVLAVAAWAHRGTAGVAAGGAGWSAGCRAAVAGGGRAPGQPTHAPAHHRPPPAPRRAPPGPPSPRCCCACP